MNDLKKSLQNFQSLDMSPVAITQRRIKMTTDEAVNPISAAANVLASLNDDVGCIDRLAIEKILDQRLKVMKHDKDTSPLQDMLYAEIMVLHALFQRLLQEAGNPNIHPERRRGLIEGGLKAQRQSRSSLETLAGMIVPKELNALIKNNCTEYHQVNTAVSVEANKS